MGPGTRYRRKVLRIVAEDSPNVRLALAEQAAGLPVSGRILVPGILPWDECLKRRATWDKRRQTVGLDAMFYEGREVLLFPPDWLARAARWHFLRPPPHWHKRSRAMGVDPAEGGDNSSWAVVDRHGVLELLSVKTPDTAVVVDRTLELIARWDLDPSRVALDRGGGKAHADVLRRTRTERFPGGVQVRTVAFGESVAPPPRDGRRGPDAGSRTQEREERYAYVNRRAQMYGELRELLDPSVEALGGHPFAVRGPVHGEQWEALAAQLSVIPLLHDREGRLRLPPKNRVGNAAASERTLRELMGRSPDEADAVVLAVHAMLHEEAAQVAGAVF
jgi:hypothetical protein